MDYMEILERVDEETRYEDTLSLVKEYLEGVPEYNNENYSTYVDGYQDGGLLIEFLLPDDKTKFIRVMYNFYSCSYEVTHNGGYSIVRITGNPYLDMRAICREIERMVSKC